MFRTARFLGDYIQLPAQGLQLLHDGGYEPLVYPPRQPYIDEEFHIYWVLLLTNVDEDAHVHVNDQ